MKENSRLAPFFVMSAGICWGIIGLFTRHLSALGFSSVQITCGRCFIGAVVMILFIAVTQPRNFRIHVRDLWMFLGLGLFSIAFFNVCYFTAIQLTTLSMAAILLYTAPSIVMVLSVILFKEAFTPVKAVCLIFAFAGCVLVSGLGLEKVNMPGVLAGLGAGLGYAMYSVFGRYALTKYSPVTVTAWTFIIGFLGLIGFSRPLEFAIMAISIPSAFFWFFMLGTVITVLPYGLYTIGLNRMEAGKASIFASVEPLASTVMGVAVFHEPLTWTNLSGIICILLAVIVLNRRG